MAFSPAFGGTGGRGGGSIRVAIRSDNSQPAVFTTFAALETYTATQSGTADAARINVSNPDNATEGFVVGSIVNNAWSGEPTVYIRVDNDWVLATANLEGPPGADGMGALDQNIEVGALLVASQASPGDPIVPAASSFIERAAMVESTKAVASTGFQSNSVMLVGAGEAITAAVASGDVYRAIGARYTKSAGTERPGFVDTDAQVDAPIQTDVSQTLSGNQLQFIFASTASGIATAYRFRSRLTTAVTGCNFISRFNSHTSEDIAFDYIRDNGGVGFTIPAEADNPNGEFTVVLPVSDGQENGVEFREDVPTYVTLVAPTGETIELAGGPLDQAGIPTQQVPFVIAVGNVGPVRGLLHNGDIDDTSTTDGLLTAAQIDMRIAANTGGPGPSEPSITSFRPDGQSTSVTPGTTISGSVMFSFAVMRPSQVDGTLTLTQDGTDIATGIDPTDTSVTAGVTSVTLAAGQSTTFTLSGTSDSGTSFSRSAVIRAAQPHEFAYYGIRATDDFATVDVSTLSSTDITANAQFDVTGAFASTHVLGILVPTNMDLQRITTLGVPVTASFTRSQGVRTINSQSYILYTLTNSGGVDGQAAYTVEIR